MSSALCHCANSDIDSILSGGASFYGDIDSLIEAGTYTINSSAQGNFPNSSKGYGMLFVRTCNNGDWIFQDFIYTDPTNLQHYHRKNINNSGWSNWFQYAQNQS